MVLLAVRKAMGGLATTCDVWYFREFMTHLERAPLWFNHSAKRAMLSQNKAVALINETGTQQHGFVPIPLISVTGEPAIVLKIKSRINRSSRGLAHRFEFGISASRRQWSRLRQMEVGVPE